MAVYKDKKRGTWYASVMYKDWTGKQCRKLKRGFATKKEAQEWQNHFSYREASNLDMTFGDFVKVYEKDMRPKLKEYTWLSKEHVIQTKLLPYFENKKMSEITSRDITQWQNVMLTKKSKSGKGYASTYLKTVQSQLSCIFNHAVRLYELSGNPVQKAGPLGEHNSIEMQFWTKEEYLQFIPTLADKPYSYLAFELLYWCGMRMGELRALTVEDFDFDKKTIAITKSYQKIKGRDVITAPKTKRSIRTIVMPEQVAIEMKDFLDSIYGLKSTDRIFTFSKSYLHHEMDRGAKASGVKRIRVHDLRHSHASLLVEMNVGYKEMADRLGHEKIQTTIDTYSHLYPNKQADIAKRLDGEFEKKEDDWL